jgi:hypothetical protein
LRERLQKAPASEGGRYNVALAERPLLTTASPIKRPFVIFFATK